MSAITGVLRFDGQAVHRDTVVQMVDTMPHRGQDGTGVWSEGEVGLGHGMFHTTTESLTEVLPLTSAAGTLVITADARIDNRDELIGLLGLNSRRGVVADSELILAAYEMWRHECLEWLVGDFTFAIWDIEKEELFCARDHFGTKPFYYCYQKGQLFAFGTEIKPMLVLPDVPAKLNEVRIGDYLAAMREDSTSTIYEGVKSLPGSHALVVSQRGLRIWRYYELAPAENVPQDASDAWYDERFRELFTEAVRCRLRSAFPVGSQLSGGMDSSSVTCVARDLLQRIGKDLHTFSLVFDELPECDERSYIDTVIEQGGVTPHFVAGDQLGPLSNVDQVYEWLDDGLIGGTQHLVWALLQASRDAGVRVVLDGVDGDNVVSHGQLYLKELAEAGEWERLAYEINTMAERFREATHKHNFEESLGSPATLFNAYVAPHLKALAERGPWWRFVAEAGAVSRHFSVSRGHLVRYFWKQMIRPHALLRLKRAWRARSESRRVEVPAIVDPAFAERIGLAERLRQFPSLKEQGHFGTSVRTTQRYLLGSPRLTFALATTDHVGAMSSVDVRHPFMDKRLIEYCLALPSSQSLRDGWTRLILRRALAHTLPEAVTWRVGKAWLVTSFERGLFELDADLLREHITNLGPLGAYASRSYVDGLYEKGKTLPNNEQAQLAQVATLSLWLKKRFSGYKAPSERGVASFASPRRIPDKPVGA